LETIIDRTSITTITQQRKPDPGTPGETYTARLAITGTNQLYLPTEIQKMLKGAGRIRVQLI